MKSETRALEMEYFQIFWYFPQLSAILFMSFLWLLCGSQTDLPDPKTSSHSFICHQDQSCCCRSTCPTPCCGSLPLILPAREMCQKLHFITLYCYYGIKLLRSRIVITGIRELEDRLWKLHMDGKKQAVSYFPTSIIAQFPLKQFS